MNVDHYAALLDALRARLAELNVSYESVDEIAGWAPGYANKIFCTPPARHLSAFSMFILLWRFGLQLSIAPNQTALEVVKSRQLKRRPAKYACHSKNAQRVVLLGRDLLVNRATSGGYARAEKLSPKRRSSIAKRAALVRWKAGSAATVPPALEPRRRRRRSAGNGAVTDQARPPFALTQE